MTDEQLNNIEAAVEDINATRRAGGLWTCVYPDLLALIAEVRRLRAALKDAGTTCEAHCARLAEQRRELDRFEKAFGGPDMLYGDHLTPHGLEYIDWGFWGVKEIILKDGTRFIAPDATPPVALDEEE